MAAFIPPAVFLIIFTMIIGNKKEEHSPHLEWRMAFLDTVIIIGCIIALLTELLSYFRSITQPALEITWAGILVGIMVYGFKRGLIQSGCHGIWDYLHGLKWKPSDRILAFCLLAYFTVLAVIALIAPPNNNDSMFYHMSRVAHWAQNGSLAHYATSYQPQLWNPIGAEIAILQSYILWGGDQLANLIQWFSMVAATMVVTMIAKQLGSDRRGQLLAAVFTATIPMGILQSTSTQNDMVVALWLVCLIFFVIAAKQRELSWYEWAEVGAIIGLGMLTKITFYMYSFPFLLWLFVPIMRRKRWKHTIVFGVGAAIIAISLNAGYWTRNIIAFGGPFGPKSWASSNSNKVHTPGLITSNIIRNLSANIGTPIPRVNKCLEEGIIRLHELIGEDPNDPRMTSPGSTFRIIRTSNHEDSAGNPIHLLLAAISAFVLIFKIKRPQLRFSVIYAIVLLCSYALQSTLVRWQIFGSRLQLPIFLAWSPIFAIAVQSLNKRPLSQGIAIMLLITGTPWLLFNQTRPVIGYEPEVTLVGSIFSASRVDLRFANLECFYTTYVEASQILTQSHCKDIGLRIDSSDPEYLIWALLDPIKNDIRIEVIDVEPPQDQYEDASFEPCAILCTICDLDMRSYRDLPIAFEDGNVRIYYDSELSK